MCMCGRFWYFHMLYTLIIPTSVIVLKVVSSEGHVMPPDFLQQGIRLNATGYTEEIGIVTKPRINFFYAMEGRVRF